MFSSLPQRFQIPPRYARPPLQKEAFGSPPLSKEGQGGFRQQYQVWLNPEPSPTLYGYFSNDTDLALGVAVIRSLTCGVGIWPAFSSISEGRDSRCRKAISCDGVEQRSLSVELG